MIMLHFSKEEIESACEIAGVHDYNLVFPGLLRSRGIRETEVLSSVFDFDTGSLNVTLRVQPNAPAHGELPSCGRGHSSEPQPGSDASAA